MSPRFSVAHGIDVRRVILVAMLAAGAVGGLGGGVHALGVVHRFVAGFSAGFGFTGIAIALLARFSATGVVLCSVLFGALASAGSTVQLFADIPLDIVDVLQGSVMVFAVARFALPRLRGRRRRA
jgi:general nucleoside transport system permease protein